MTTMVNDLSQDENGQMSQTDVVVYGIKRMILDGELAPGDKLPIEKDLAPKLGVSRGSLREGVRALSIMGVLETRQGAGMFVTSLDASLLLAPMGFVVDLQEHSGVHHVHSVRRTLETDAAARAALRVTDDDLAVASEILDRAERAIEERDHEAVIEADMQFHRVIAEAAGNPVLAALIEALSSRTLRGRMWRSIRDEHADAATAKEHRAILRALSEHDPQAAQIRMSNHLLEVEEFLQERPPVDADLSDSSDQS
ncbi:FadR/GntR family transcriptional regulator [Agromyces silvae]|uniref:FadR/GntR family transcriptional regulator n=1 Tax=Agromyces silvae TaxID=3388266 RepID=UPI00280C187F|nr:FadR/GntR family transcriptional regulator [Agromyces protaetiae]